MNLDRYFQQRARVTGDDDDMNDQHDVEENDDELVSLDATLAAITPLKFFAKQTKTATTIGHLSMSRKEDDDSTSRSGTEHDEARSDHAARTLVEETTLYSAPAIAVVSPEPRTDERSTPLALQRESLVEAPVVQQSPERKKDAKTTIALPPVDLFDSDDDSDEDESSPPEDTVPSSEHIVLVRDDTVMACPTNSAPPDSTDLPVVVFPDFQTQKKKHTTTDYFNKSEEELNINFNFPQNSSNITTNTPTTNGMGDVESKCCPRAAPPVDEDEEVQKGDDCDETHSETSTGRPQQEDSVLDRSDNGPTETENATIELIKRSPLALHEMVISDPASTVPLQSPITTEALVADEDERSQQGSVRATSINAHRTVPTNGNGSASVVNQAVGSSVDPTEEASQKSLTMVEVVPSRSSVASIGRDVVTNISSPAATRDSIFSPRFPIGTAYDSTEIGALQLSKTSVSDETEPAAGGNAKECSAAATIAEVRPPTVERVASEETPQAGGSKPNELETKDVHIVSPFKPLPSPVLESTKPLPSLTGKVALKPTEVADDESTLASTFTGYGSPVSYVEFSSSNTTNKERLVTAGNTGIREVKVKPIFEPDDGRLEFIPTLLVANLWSDDEPKVRVALDQMGQLCSQPEKIVEMLAHGGHMSLVLVLRKWSSSAEVQAAGLETLHRAAESLDFCNAVVQLGALELAVVAMKNHPNNEDIQRAGCGALLNLTLPATFAKQLVFELDGIPTVARACATFPHDVILQKYALWLIQYMSYWDDFKEPIVKGGGLQILTKIVEAFSNSTDKSSDTILKSARSTIQRLL